MNCESVNLQPILATSKIRFLGDDSHAVGPTSLRFLQDGNMHCDLNPLLFGQLRAAISLVSRGSSSVVLVDVRIGRWVT